jgi:hypothetical protein
MRVRMRVSAGPFVVTSGRRRRGSSVGVGTVFVAVVVLGAIIKLVEWIF